MRQYGDILRVDLVDTYGDLSMKTMKLFATLPGKVTSSAQHSLCCSLGCGWTRC